MNVIRLQGGCRFANHHIAFTTVKGVKFGIPILIGCGYAVSDPERDGSLMRVIARGPQDEQLMKEICETFNAVYEGFDHAIIGPWVPIQDYWEQTESTPWLA